MSSNQSISTNTTSLSVGDFSSSTTVRYPKKLFMDVSPSTTSFDLRVLMEQYGQVNQVHIPVNQENGASRGFAFVTFRWYEDALYAMQQLEGKTLDGIVLHPRWATPKTNKQDHNSNSNTRTKPKRNGNRRSKRQNKKLMGVLK